MRARDPPPPFPGHGLPEDGLTTVAARDGRRTTLGVTGHPGHEPGTLTAAKPSYPYDGGETWTEARTERRGDTWSAAVGHAGATGEQLTPRTEPTDAGGHSVTQLVVGAYAVR